MNPITNFGAVAIVLLTIVTACDAQIRNQKTETVKIYGNCEMCKQTIEKAGNLKNAVKVVWNEKTKMATFVYDSKKTGPDEILKHIALAGYDSDKFLAPDNVYATLASCCQYERKAKLAVKMETPKMDSAKMDAHDHAAMTGTKAGVPPLKAVFDNYFAIKDALVKTDGNTASAKANDLLIVIKDVKMEQLATDEHMAWMKVMKDLASDARSIAETKDPSRQRGYFSALSKNMYVLMKVSRQETPTYFQHCPMANDGKGADWLSKESVIKNPYYGAQMLSCGNTVETIK
jgi:Protein of unknown function (DUF3347)